MKKHLVFAGAMGVLLMGAANAEVVQNFPADTTHPEFTAESNQAKPYAVRESNIKAATTNYVNNRLDEANADVQALAGTAATDAATVDTNATAIAAMQTGRQVHPGTDTCSTASDNDLTAAGTAAGASYVACGYIVPNGTNADSNTASNYNWVKIVTVPSLES